MKPILFNGEMVKAILDGRKTQTRRVVKWVQGNDNRNYAINPFQAEEILYVRETYCELPVKPDGTSSGVTTHIYYRADGDLRPKAWQGNWEPSIFMPKAAARIFLRVTDVRVDRLQNITVEDCKKEGIYDDYKTLTKEYHDLLMSKAYIETFAKLWDSTIKKSDLPIYGWAASPWVWVVEFERISKEEAMRSNEP